GEHDAHSNSRLRRGSRTRLAAREGESMHQRSRRARACVGALGVLALSAAGCHQIVEVLPSAGTAGSNWPTYGGEPGRSGFSAGETKLGVASVEAIAPRWQVDIGMGSWPPAGTPSVSGGRVFVGSSVAEGDNFFAFDAASGRRLWSTNLGHGVINAGGITIAATPAVAGSVVVAGGGDQAYYGLQAETGAVLWRHAMDAGASAFAWCSPL